MSKRVLLLLAATGMMAAPLMAAVATAAPSAKPSPAIQGVLQNTYYANAGIPGPSLDGVNSAIVRIVNDSGADLCALVYVTDQDQEMRECCGCLVTQGGTDTLNVTDNLISNPANGVATTTGSIAIVSSAASACNPSAPKLTPELEAWSTHTGVSVTEEELTPLPLSSAAQGNLVAQCAAIHLIGSGKGICTCGTVF